MLGTIVILVIYVLGVGIPCYIAWKALNKVGREKG